MTNAEEIRSLATLLIGRRVRVNNVDFGKLGGITSVVGTCSFLGYNEYFPSYGLQITIDRMPITNIEIKQIELICE